MTLQNEMAPLKKGLYVMGQKVAAAGQAFWGTHRHDRPPILIYQMGKVGSRSVYYSLKGAGLPNPVFFIHFLSDRLPEYKKIHEDAGIVPVPYHIELGLALRKRLDRAKDMKGIRIITMVREPISRHVSDIFQNPALVKTDIFKNNGLIDPERAYEYVAETFSRPETFDYVFNWFDTELKPVFGIDIFAHPFDREQGWSIISGDRANVLVMRLEDLTRAGEAAVNRFIQPPEKISLAKANIRSATADGDAYRQVREKIRLDRTVCEKIYSSRFVRHFYTDKQVEEMIRGWTGEGAPGGRTE